MKYVDSNGNDFGLAIGIGGAAVDLALASNPIGWVIGAILIIGVVTYYEGPTIYHMIAPQTTAPSPNTLFIDSSPEEQFRNTPDPTLERSGPERTGRHQTHANEWAAQNGISGTDQENWDNYVNSAHNDIKNYEENGEGTLHHDNKYNNNALRTPDDWLVGYNDDAILTKYNRGRDGWNVNYEGAPRFIIPK